jgi:hypothetical protein
MSNASSGRRDGADSHVRTDRPRATMRPHTSVRLPVFGAFMITAVRLWLGPKKPVIMRRHAGRQAISSTANN